MHAAIHDRKRSKINLLRYSENSPENNCEWPLRSGQLAVVSGAAKGQVLLFYGYQQVRSLRQRACPVLHNPVGAVDE